MFSRVWVSLIAFVEVATAGIITIEFFNSIQFCEDVPAEGGSGQSTECQGSVEVGLVQFLFLLFNLVLRDIAAIAFSVVPFLGEGRKKQALWLCKFWFVCAILVSVFQAFSVVLYLVQIRAVVKDSMHIFQLVVTSVEFMYKVCAICYLPVYMTKLQLADEEDRH